MKRIFFILPALILFLLVAAPVFAFFNQVTYWRNQQATTCSPHMSSIVNVAGYDEIKIEFKSNITLNTGSTLWVEFETGSVTHWYRFDITRPTKKINTGRIKILGERSYLVVVLQNCPPLPVYNATGKLYKVPDTPAIPDVPGVPEMPKLPNLPSLPSLPNFP